MRIGGVALLLIGLLATIVCGMNGCSSFFTFNGRHPVDTTSLEVGLNHRTFTTFPGRRYTISVKVVFDPTNAPEKNGMADVQAKMSLVVRAKDDGGTKLAELNGWLDPQEPPNVFYTGPVRPQAGTVRPRELAVERLVGPFLSSGQEKVDVEVDLGADRLMRVPILARQLTIYDDALPGSIRNAAIGAGLGITAAIAGFGILVVGWWRNRNRKKKRKPGKAVPA